MVHARPRPAAPLMPARNRVATAVCQSDPPNPDSVNFVGTISAFGNIEEDNAAGHPGHGSHAMASHTFDVSQAISFIAPREVTVTLIPVSTEPLQQRAIARFGAISIYQH